MDRSWAPPAEQRRPPADRQLPRPHRQRVDLQPHHRRRSAAQRQGWRRHCRRLALWAAHRRRRAVLEWKLNGQGVGKPPAIDDAVGSVVQPFAAHRQHGAVVGSLDFGCISALPVRGEQCLDLLCTFSKALIFRKGGRHRFTIAVRLRLDHRKRLPAERSRQAFRADQPSNPRRPEQWHGEQAFSDINKWLWNWLPGQ